jgi:general secretion pathway protein J
MTRRRGAAAGFTLIELLVALALTAAILVLLFSGINLGFRGMDRLDGQVARIEARRSLAFTLRRQIAGIYPATLGSVGAATFAGRPTVVSFLSLDGAAGAGYSRVWLMLEDTPDGRNLVLMRRPQLPGLLVGFERTVLARRVTGFSLAYFGATAAGAPRDWHESWEGLRAPPELIRVALALSDDGAYAWPDEVVRVWTAGIPP